MFVHGERYAAVGYIPAPGTDFLADEGGIVGIVPPYGGPLDIECIRCDIEDAPDRGGRIGEVSLREVQKHRLEMLRPFGALTQVVLDPFPFRKVHVEAEHDRFLVLDAHRGMDGVHRYGRTALVPEDQFAGRQKLAGAGQRFPDFQTLVEKRPQVEGTTRSPRFFPIASSAVYP